MDASPQRFPFAFDGIEERVEIKHLRQHSEYLAPRHGPLQLDTWRLISTYLGGLLVTLFTVAAIIGVIAAVGIVVYPRVLGVADRTGFWTDPSSHRQALFAPAMVAFGLWVLLSSLYALATVVPRLWTLNYRRRVTSWHGLLLLATGLLAALGGIPFLLVSVDPALHRVAPYLTGASVLSLASLVRGLKLGETAKGPSAQIKKWAAVLAAWVLVSLVCLFVLYMVWKHQDIAGAIGGGLAVALVLLSLFTDINRVSLYYFYRDRLSDAFIFKRPPGSKDQVVSNDGELLSELTYADRRVPYHLINATVNLAGSQDLGLRGRKADFFLLSPLYCGSHVTGYVPTKRYEENRLTLSSAMATSGAAVNPQHGRGTSPPLAFLMGLVNARLGVWAENPRFQAGRLARLRKPRRLWPYYLLLELLSRSNEQRSLINVSDGGHIENLGVYQLLLRRCKTIIASDASADPERSFADLGTLLREARIDLGIEIDIDVEPLRPTGADVLSQAHVVKGNIHYPTPNGHSVEGTFWYIKAALTRIDPPDLRAYRADHDKFPHESTVDQFFSEPQFESYRELGYQSGRALAALMTGTTPA